MKCQADIANSWLSKADDCNVFMFELFEVKTYNENFLLFIKDSRDYFSSEASNTLSAARSELPLRMELLIKKHGGLFLDDIINNNFNISQDSLIPCH